MDKVELEPESYNALPIVTTKMEPSDELRDSDEQLRFFFNNVPLGIYRTTPDGRILMANPALLQMLGFQSLDELTARNLEKEGFEETDSRKLFKQLLERDGEVRGFESAWTHRNGSAVFVRENVITIRAKDNSISHYEGTVEDITECKRAEEVLKKIQAEYRELYETAPIGYHEINADGVVVRINQSGAELLGYCIDEMIGQPIYSFAVDKQVSQKAVNEKLAEKRLLETFERTLRRKDGSTVDVLIKERLVRDEENRVIGIRSTVQDITERRAAEAELRKSEAELRALFAAMTDTILMVNKEGRLLKVAPTNPALPFQPPAEMIGKTLHEVFPEVPADYFLKQIQRALMTKQPVSVEHNLMINNTEVWFDVTASPMTEDLLVWVARDVTERKHVEDRLAHEAFHDAMTGLPNRALFLDHLKLAVERAKRHDDYRFAVMFLDLDRFKNINDSLGHLVGDCLLIETARRLEQCLRPGDTVARLGGDEFTILLDAIRDANEAIEVSTRLQQALSRPFNVSGHEVHTTVSIGIATSNIGDTEARDFLRDADTAMYQAKTQGKAQHKVFNPTMHARATDLLALENALRRATEHNQFVLHYQPIVSLQTGEVYGFEALVRWQHPERGLILPDNFIRVAEETGLIIPIGTWVMGEACRQMRCWQDEIFNRSALVVNVNLSYKQFAQPDLFDQVAHILRATNLRPNTLKLEITESSMMEGTDKAIELLKRLRALGVELSMDDFGTGYSSLSNLHNLPLNSLKIDRSFINGMDGGSKNSQIVRTIIVLAHNLGMHVVAEGVETEEQLEQLRAYGCEYGQGYVFSKPLEAVAATRLLMNAAHTYRVEGDYTDILIVDADARPS